MEDKLILKINRNNEDGNKSADYDVYVNDWKLGRGVLGVNLDMQAPKRPLLTIECHPDEIKIGEDGIEIDLEYQEKEYY